MYPCNVINCTPNLHHDETSVLTIEYRQINHLSNLKMNKLRNRQSGKFQFKEIKFLKKFCERECERERERVEEGEGEGERKGKREKEKGKDAKI